MPPYLSDEHDGVNLRHLHGGFLRDMLRNLEGARPDHRDAQAPLCPFHTEGNRR